MESFQLLARAAEQLNIPAPVALVLIVGILAAGILVPVLVFFCFPSRVRVGVISRLLVYPVKGCKPLEVKEWPLGKSGLLWDRTWMIVRADTHSFVSQRQASVLGGISVALESVGGGGDVGVRKPWEADAVRLSAPGCGSVVVKLVTGDGDGDGGGTSVSLFSSTVRGVDQGDDAAEWLTNAIHTMGGDLVADGSKSKPSEFAERRIPLRLLHCPSPEGAGAAGGSEGTRSVSAKHMASGYRTTLSFSDSMPILVASESNTKDLTRRMQKRRKSAGESAPPAEMETPLDIRRFRPNVVVNQPRPWFEDHWRTVSIERLTAAGGDKTEHVARLTRSKRCGRCSVPSVDLTTFKRGGFRAEPLETLRTFRRHPEKKSDVCFGSYFLLDRASEGAVVAVGDVLDMLEFDDRTV